MNATDHLIDIICSLGKSLTAWEEIPAGWRPLGEALLHIEGVRGVLLATWTETAPVAVIDLGEMPCAVTAMVEGLRAALWESRTDSTPITRAFGCDVPVLAAPLGKPDQPQGVIALVAVEPEPRLGRVVEAIAAGLTVALQHRQLARENQRLENSVQVQMSRMGELAAVGQLAASVAHELRNPLSSIKGAAQYLRDEYQEHLTVREFLDIILEEVGVLSRITTEFLDFARPMHLDLREAHLHDNIRKLLQVMKPQMAAQNIETVMDLGPEVPLTVFDGEQIDHVLRNIVLNAVQAMPEGGVLMVRTRYIATPLPGVEIVVSDTGRGIPVEDLGKLFTPFFTTKTKGVGLGLTIVQKIVQNHGGSVAVESETGQGSSFFVRLPRAPGAENLRVN